MQDKPPRRATHARISLTEDEARDFLRRLVEDEDFRRSIEADPRAALLEYRIDISAESVPETVTLPPPEQISELVQSIDAGNYLTPQSTEVLGFIILHFVLGAMPVVAADD